MALAFQRKDFQFLVSIKKKKSVDRINEQWNDSLTMASFSENKTNKAAESAIFDSDLFKSDKKTIDTVKVITKIWENRANSENISKLAELLW